MFNFSRSKESKGASQQQERSSKQKDIETASVSTYASDDTITQEKAETKAKPKNGTNFSVQDIKDQALRSQIRIGI